MKGIERFSDPVSSDPHLPRDGRRAAAVLLDYPIYVLACTCLLPRESQGILSPARIIGDFFGAFILPVKETVSCGRTIDGTKQYVLLLSAGRVARVSRYSEIVI